VLFYPARELLKGFMGRRKILILGRLLELNSDA
jgi:hypothetical protein